MSVYRYEKSSRSFHRSPHPPISHHVCPYLPAYFRNNKGKTAIEPPASIILALEKIQLLRTFNKILLSTTTLSTFGNSHIDLHQLIPTTILLRQLRQKCEDLTGSLLLNFLLGQRSLFTSSSPLWLPLPPAHSHGLLGGSVAARREVERRQGYNKSNLILEVVAFVSLLYST